jgi:hypothetical protein
VECINSSHIIKTDPAGDRDLISRAASIERTIIRLTDKLSSIAAELDRQVNGANVALKKRELAVVRCIAFAAMIQLHNRFVSGDGTSTSKTPAESTVSKRSAGMCLQAAHKVASAAENITTDEVEFLDTVVGVSDLIFYDWSHLIFAPTSFSHW